MKVVIEKAETVGGKRWRTARSSERRWPTIVLVIGIALLIAALQAWVFDRGVQQQSTSARTQLTLLQQEMLDNRLLNLSLAALQDYWRLSDEDTRKRQALELRDLIITRLKSYPGGSIAEFARGVAALEAQTRPQQELLTKLQNDADRLFSMYTDHFSKAKSAYAEPRWYLQPTAGFLNNDTSKQRTLEFNHALYLTQIRASAPASELLHKLHQGNSSDSLTPNIQYALARLNYQLFELEKDPADFRTARQYARQAVQNNADDKRAKLFLAYLLAVNQDATSIDAAPDRGDGSGEGEGERGTIANDSGEF